jgi:hypothetical protein
MKIRSGFFLLDNYQTTFGSSHKVDQLIKLWSRLDFSRFVFLIKPIRFGEFLAAYRVNFTGVYN